MTQVDLPTFIEALVAFSGLTGIGAGVKWFFFGGRKRARVDSAQVVQKMAVDTLTLLMKPLQDDLAKCQVQLGDLRVELETVLDYAILAHAIFAQPAVAQAIVANGGQIPSTPDLVLKRP